MTPRTIRALLAGTLILASLIVVAPASASHPPSPPVVVLGCTPPAPPFPPPYFCFYVSAHLEQLDALIDEALLLPDEVGQAANNIIAAILIAVDRQVNEGIFGDPPCEIACVFVPEDTIEEILNQATDVVTAFLEFLGHVQEFLDAYLDAQLSDADDNIAALFDFIQALQGSLQPYIDELLLFISTFNPLDLDGDGYSNLVEARSNSNPANYYSTPFTDDDGDGIPNFMDAAPFLGGDPVGWGSDPFIWLGPALGP